MRYILLGLLLLLGSFTNAYVRNEEISFAMKTLRDEVIQWRQLPPRNLPQFAVDKVALNTPVLTDVAEAATTQVQFTLGDDRFLSSWLPVVQNGKALCGLTLSIDYSGSYIVDVQWFTEYCFEKSKPLSLSYEWRHAATNHNTRAYDIFLVMSAVFPVVAAIMVWNKL